MKRISIFIIAVITTLASQGQKASIIGWIADETGLPVPASTVSLLAKEQGQPIAQVISGGKGEFSLEAPAGKSYILLISRVGFLPFSKEIPSLSAADLGKIVLKLKADSLQTVTVSAARSLITRKIDRVVLNVENNPLAAGKSAIELFRYAPGVVIQNGNISINGISHAMVMVNGRLLRLSGRELTEFLSTLRAEEIASIEFIPNPPAEYDASAGGLINIIYKKQKKNGFNGSISSSYAQGRYPGFNESAGLNYKEDKLTLSANYSKNWSNGYGTTRNTRTSDSSGYSYQYSAFRKDVSTGDRLRLGATYDINSRQYIGLDYSHSTWNYNSPYQTTTSINSPGTAPVLLNGVFPQNSYSGFNNLGFNYNAKLDSLGTTLTFLSDYTWNSSNNTNSAITDYYSETSASYQDTSYRNIINGASHVYTADLKLDLPLSKRSTFSMGGKLVLADISDTVDFQNANGAQWIKDVSQSYLYKYKENIYAGFVDYSGKVLQTDIKLGLRGEYTATDGFLSDAGTTTDNKNGYFGLFPSLFVQRSLNKAAGNDISFSYRRGIYRPDYSQLDPFVIYIDNYTTIQGNPYLKPQYANQYQLQYTWHNDYSAAFIYEEADNIIYNILHTIPGDSLHTWYAPENLNTRKDYILVLNVPVKVLKGWSMYNTAVFKQEKLDAGDIHYNKPTVLLQTSQDISLPHGYRVSVNGSYISAFEQGNIAVAGHYRIDMGVQKALLKNKLTARLSINDLFNSDKNRTTIYYQDYTQKGFEKGQTQSVGLQLIYNFKFGKAFTVKSIDRSNSEESSRLGVK